MKNTLAENLLRFGAKNLSESDKQNLQEQGNVVNSPLSLILKYEIDPGTKQKKYTEYVTFSTPIEVKAFDKGYVYESVSSFTFDLSSGWENIVPRKQSKSQNMIIGEMRISQNIMKFLMQYLNKGKITKPITTIGLIPLVKNNGQLVKANSNAVLLTVTEQASGQTPTTTPPAVTAPK
jgi:hypothetical protein